MRINQNSMAINAFRNLSTTNVALGKSLEKLSSGFRINRAADDAAGLVISQNLRAQVSGLRQATRNCSICPAGWSQRIGASHTYRFLTRR